METRAGYKVTDLIGLVICLSLETSIYSQVTMDTRLEVRRLKSMVDGALTSGTRRKECSPCISTKSRKTWTTDGPTGWLPERQRDRLSFWFKFSDE